MLEHVHERHGAHRAHETVFLELLGILRNHVSLEGILVLILGSQAGFRPDKVHADVEKVRTADVGMSAGVRYVNLPGCCLRA